MDTVLVKQKEFVSSWYQIDATDVILGRLAVAVAYLVMGKHLPYYTPYWNSRVSVIITNCSAVKFTGGKLKDKKYVRHSGYPGGLKSKSLEQAMNQDPRFVVRKAIKGMLPHNRLSRTLINNVYLYADSVHKHIGQSPLQLKSSFRSIQDLYSALSETAVQKNI